MFDQNEQSKSLVSQIEESHCKSMHSYTLIERMLESESLLLKTGSRMIDKHSLQSNSSDDLDLIVINDKPHLEFFEEFKNKIETD